MIVRAPNMARSIEFFSRSEPIRAFFSRKERGPPFIQSVSHPGCMWKQAVELCKLSRLSGFRIASVQADGRKAFTHHDCYVAGRWRIFVRILTQQRC